MLKIDKNDVPATDIWVMSIAPTQIHLAVSAPKATGSDCSNGINIQKITTATSKDVQFKCF